MKPTRAPFEKPVIRPLPLPVWLAYLLVCTLLLTGVSLARYITTADGSDAARVASGLVTVDYEENTTQMEMVRPWDDGVLTEDFKFTVSNNSSEVAIRYDVVVTLDKALGEGVTMTLDEKKGTKTDEGKQYEFANVGTFAAGVDQTNTHTLSFAGDFNTIESGTDDNYDIQISIRSRQID